MVILDLGDSSTKCGSGQGGILVMNAKRHREDVAIVKMMVVVVVVVVVVVAAAEHKNHKWNEISSVRRKFYFSYGKCWYLPYIRDFYGLFRT